MESLEGFLVGVTADRRSGEQSELLRRRGASVLHGPSISTQYLDSDENLRRATDSLIARPPDYLVATTGIGIRAWLETAQAWGMGEDLVKALVGTAVLARGPKAAAAARSAGVEVSYQSTTERLDDLVAELQARSVAGRRVAVQEYGAKSPELSAALTTAGAEVVEVPVYRWCLPKDRGPALRLIEATCERRVDAVTFTSAPAVNNLFEIAGAASSSLLRAFNHEVAGRTVAAACVGPVCAEAARQMGIRDPLEPPLGRLGLMVRRLSEHFDGRRREFSVAGVRLVVQGSLISVDGTPGELSPRERQVFELLAARPGVVLGPGTLATTVWGAGSDPHLAEVTVARLRRRLGACGRVIETRAGRGYFLDADERAGVGPA